MQIKKYNEDEFLAEILRRSGWSYKKFQNYLHERDKGVVHTYDDEDVNLILERMNKYEKELKNDE